MSSKINDKDLFNLIMSYFPQYKDDQSLSLGGDCFGLPYLALSEILLNHVFRIGFMSEKDSESFSNFINDMWRGSSEPEIDFIIKDSILDHIKSEKEIVSKVHLKGEALVKANNYLVNDPRFSGILFE